MSRVSQYLPTLLLVALPVAYVAFLYLVPLGGVALRSVDNSTIHANLPVTAGAIGEAGAPSDEAAAALAKDLATADRRSLGELARLLNLDAPGMRSLLLKTKRALDEVEVRGLADLRAIDPAWDEPVYWQALAENAQPYTFRYYATAIGLDRDPAGGWQFGTEGAIYLQILLRTFWMSLQVAVIACLIAYPLAHAIANGPPTVRLLLLGAVLLSFWMSILVRTTAWVVILQREGLVNEALMALGLVREPVQLIFNRLGTLLAMVHVLLPFAVLPLLNNMKQIPAQQRDAARSLGAGPFESFVRVYLPQTMRGILVGAGTVFILSLGFYITPALVGSPGDQLLSYYIADFMLKQLNWGMASTLSVILLACVLLGLVVAWLVNLMWRPAGRPA
ncbi:MAG TPA: ABC transporter permease [Geminicoccus sp.]|uniref:ABC transporter permease n=1 Tax=Geminicoccus sp. TaxID=2024832 RepID=UPI002C1DCFB2|nr:ABC transporter permease [Geminicoccus sp.]HWL70978.1 ABC transporter permease [Geminicoccus sp.]